MSGFGLVPIDPVTAAPADDAREGFNWRRWRVVMVGGTIVSLLILVAILAPWIAPYDPLALDTGKMLQPPSAAHWLGSDELGRDTLSRAIWAARVSMMVAVLASLVGLVFGTIFGTVAAYFGGWVDMVLMRIMEVLFSFPAILLAVVLMASLGTSTLNAMIAIGIIFIPGFARLARAVAEAVLRQQYVEAARALGMSHTRIMLREVLPDILAPLLVEAAVAFSYAVLLESALSFLGLGAQPPEASWGNMIATGRGFLSQAPWLSMVPGFAIFMTVAGFNTLGDGLRDAFDPHLRN